MLTCGALICTNQKALWRHALRHMSASLQGKLLKWAYQFLNNPVLETALKCTALYRVLSKLIQYPKEEEEEEEEEELAGSLCLQAGEEGF